MSNKERSEKNRKRAARGSALGALLLAWGQGKLSEHPPRLGWVDLVILAGLGAAWLLQRPEKKGEKK